MGNIFQIRYIIPILLILGGTTVFAQTTIWSEDFSSYADGIQNGAGSGTSTATWSTNDGDVDVRTTSGNKVLRGQNTDNTTARWTTNAIDISGFTTVVFSLDVASGGGLDSGQDFFRLEYRIDGGSYIQIENASGDTSPSDPIQPSYTVPIASGSALYFRITFYNTGNTEFYEIDNVLVTGTAAAPNEPPVVTATGNQAYCAGTSMPIVETISITDLDDTTTSSVFIQISTGYVNGEDLLSLTGSHPNITPSWDAVQGELALTGPATYVEFEAAIAAVEYSSSAGNPTGTRQFSITVGSANYLPYTGHYYEYVSSLGITWTNANTAANGRTYFGLQGYLATLTSQEEADFSGSQASGVGWIGGSDAGTEGVWLWVTGPEAGTNFWNGTAGGSSPNFAFWNTGEPNQSGDEDYAHITHPNVNPNGSWNDLTNTGAASGNYQPQGYVVEYGGMSGDPVLSITATTTLTMDTIDPTASNPAPININCASEVPAPDVSVVTDEADNCTANPTVTFINDVSDGGSNPEIITRTYRVADDSGNDIDVAQTITVNPFQINSQPTDQSVFSGTSANLSVLANFVDTYQWQVSTNGGGSFIDVTDGAEYAGATTSSLTVLSPDIDKNGFIYRLVLSKSGASCPPIVSNNALLTIQVGSVISNRRISYRVNRG